MDRSLASADFGVQEALIVGGIIGMISSNREDFWLNVLAGVPFLLVDLIIITLLLPWVIEWWNDRRWASIRKVAIMRLLIDYDGVTKLGARLDGLARRRWDDVGPGEIDPLSASIFDFEDVARAMIAKSELSIQTVLPIMGPKEVRLLLNYHMAWVHALNELLDVMLAIQRAPHSGSAHSVSSMIDELSEVSAVVQVRSYEIQSAYAGAKREQAHYDGRLGALWESNYLDRASQALETLMALRFPDFDMSEIFRRRRAGQRRTAINYHRKRLGVRPITTPVRLYDFAEPHPLDRK